MDEPVLKPGEDDLREKILQIKEAAAALAKTLTARWRPVQDIFTWERLEMKNERSGAGSPCFF